jgi:hypothetical protein
VPRFTYSPGCSRRATFRAIKSGGRPRGPDRALARFEVPLLAEAAREVQQRRRIERVLGATTRSTKMPGVTIVSGSSAPGSTISSTSAIVRARRGRERRIEVPRAAAIREVAVAVRAMRAHDRDVGTDRALEHVAAAVELAHLLARGRVGADAGRRVDRGEPRPARAHALDERALRHELERDAPALMPSPIGAGWVG